MLYVNNIIPGFCSQQEIRVHLNRLIEPEQGRRTAQSMDLDMSIRIGGQAGQGVQAVSHAVGKVFTRHGRYVLIHQDVESRIRGGHNYAQIRIQDRPVQSIKDRPDLLIALDQRTIEEDLPDLAEDGVLIFDGENADPGPEPGDPNRLSVPLQRLADEAGGGRIMANTVATGAALASIGAELDPLLDYLEEQFRDKGRDAVNRNRACASAGYRHVRERAGRITARKISMGGEQRGRLLLSGGEAMAVGSICAGLKFYAGYPMSPSTAIMEYVASQSREYNIVVEPAEDEIAALNMVIGASFAGVRAMTATSGGGFCLMVEALGLAGMTETPLVVVIGQRPGPATGLPTRTEQGDLAFVVHAAHGDFPRAVLAPGNAEQAFYAMGRAFNLADRYQTPVVVLADQYLLDSYFTVDGLDPSRVTIDRGKILEPGRAGGDPVFRRYALDPSGVSPRILPGRSEAVLYACSDEHTEEGHITESAEIRKAMMRKRMEKLEGIRRESEPPECHPASDGADLVLLGWGSVQGPLREAVDRLRAEGVRARMLHCCDVYPLRREGFAPRIGDRAKVVAVENNYTGQFADLLLRETGIRVAETILKYDGRPFSAEEIASRARDLL
jgi:2-oxoglutarate ferredoxin oxidoreductase subunit alpha